MAVAKNNDTVSQKTWSFVELITPVAYKYRRYLPKLYHLSDQLQTIQSKKKIMSLDRGCIFMLTHIPTTMRSAIFRQSTKFNILDTTWDHFCPTII